jgi:hypothetical protein
MQLLLATSAWPLLLHASMGFGLRIGVILSGFGAHVGAGLHCRTWWMYTWMPVLSWFALSMWHSLPVAQYRRVPPPPTYLFLVVADLLRHLVSLLCPPTPLLLLQALVGAGSGPLTIPLDAFHVLCGLLLLFGGPHALSHD